ncbi:hypothetical protein GCM10017786_06510 [Amycolatopsis deserti]|uniref:Uncharacterized protein n=1 Tax=Amycolatopsis deserti TaxID=185696 RepID=A0ABQ3IIH1_9PSEU|nr:hypothetical protein GCM10017786_06510 [Amycolatopsis deserti]
MAPCTNTPPAAELSQATSAKRSAVVRARLRQISSCPSASTLIPSRGRSLRRGHVDEDVWKHTETSGGSTDTEVNELAAMPTGSPSTSAHTAVTPDGKHPNARRSVPESAVIGSKAIIVSVDPPLGKPGTNPELD